MRGLVFSLCLSVVPCWAFLPGGSPTIRPSSPSTTTRVYAGDATAASIKSLHNELFNSLKAFLKIEPTDFPATMNVDSWSKGGWQGKVSGYKGNPKLVWTGEGYAESSDTFISDIVAFVGPLTQTPHLRVSLASSPKGVHLSLDYTPRDDLAYTTGNDHLQEFYVPATKAYEQAIGDPAVTDRVMVFDRAGRVLQSPVATSVILPPGAASVSKVSSWAKSHIAVWQGWVTNTPELQRMKRGQMLSRDTAVRRLWVEAKAAELSLMLGDEAQAKTLAIALGGPLQQQYVGQAS